MEFQSNFFLKLVCLSLLFLKMPQFPVAFGIMFTYFILAHKVLHSQASACLFSIICFFPTCTLHFSQMGSHEAPWMGHDTLCLRVFLYSLPCEKLSPSAHMVTGSVLEGPLCSCSLITSAPSHFVLKLLRLEACCVLLPALILLLPHPCRLKVCPSFEDQLRHCHLLPPLDPQKHFVALFYLIIIIWN